MTDKHDHPQSTTLNPFTPRSTYRPNRPTYLFPIHEEPSVIRDATDGLFQVIRDPAMPSGLVQITDLNLGMGADELTQHLESGGYSGTIRVNGTFTTVLSLARLCAPYSIRG